jgi:short subunit dehydrogenase-like uncharacterized protein
MPDSHASAVAVYGASGHTGGFVLDELARRGIPAVAVGRRAAQVRTGAPVRVAPIDDAAALARAFEGCAVVINVAGPFLDTAPPVIAAALEAGCHYIDVTAEQESARTTLEAWDAAARVRGVAVIPAAGFYGGLADVLASRLAGDAAIDALAVAVALDRWWPTPGTRKTGERNRFPRVVVDGGRLVPMPTPAPGRPWDFGPPYGVTETEQVPFSEAVTIAHHLPVRNLRSYLSASALRDVRDPATAAPQAADAQGRSPQTFTMQVVLEDADGTRRATVRGRDIYAVSAPLVVEAAARLLRPGSARSGATTLGAAFDPHDLLRTLAPAHFSLEVELEADRDVRAVRT